MGTIQTIQTTRPQATIDTLKRPTSKKANGQYQYTANTTQHEPRGIQAQHDRLCGHYGSNTMRKITKQAVKAFMNGEDFNLNNTQVTNFKNDKTRLLLHGHCIATKTNQQIVLNNCGYATNTTKERLNGILDVLGVGRIYQIQFIWYWKTGQEFPYGQDVIVV